MSDAEYLLAERAAIMEFDGNMSRTEAEQKARADYEQLLKMGLIPEQFQRGKR